MGLLLLRRKGQVLEEREREYGPFSNLSLSYVARHSIT